MNSTYSKLCITKKFQLKITILILWTKLAQRPYLWPKEENVHHYQILHILISLSTKFQLKITIPFFGLNLLENGFCSLK